MSDSSSGAEFILPGSSVGGGGVGVEDDGVEFSTPVGSAAHEEHAEFAAGVPLNNPRRRERPPAELQTRGTFWRFVFTKRTDATGWMQGMVEGMIELQWELVRRSGGDAGVGGGTCGEVAYTVLRVVFMEAPVDLPADLDASDPIEWLRVRGIVGPRLCSTGETVSTFLSQGGRMRGMGLLECSRDEARTVTLAHEGGPGPFLFRSVLIYRRWADASRIIGDTPDRQTLRRWRKLQQAEPDVEMRDLEEQEPERVVSDMDPLLYVPPNYVAEGDMPTKKYSGPSDSRFGDEIDPVRLVHALGVVRHLRSPKNFVEAVDDSYAYIFQLDDAVSHRRPGRNLDPSVTSLRRTLARADVVGCNLTRRLFKSGRKNGVVKAINVYSDASPVVGVELQGMIIDVVFTNGHMERIILPGSTLAYGHTTTLDKGVALLQAIWLVAGPTLDDIQWFLSKVRSLTTDFGVEMHLLDVPDISEAFIAWMNGRPLHTLRMLVKPDRRLFRLALRIAGWSHTMGGIMKAVAEHFEGWPAHLDKLRTLCTFYKNKSYRRHIRRRLELEPEEDRNLIHFTAGFAKWRYETVFEVLRQLLQNRTVSESKVSPELFAHAQDKELISSVIKACRDKPFWRFCSTSFNKVFASLEYLRRWGMACECPDHILERREKRQFIKCPRILDQ